MGTANTNIVWHGRKLLALKEDSLPIELDPETLATRGEWRYEGDVSAVSLTAHPKLDYHTNELLTFSYQARGDGTTDIVFYIAAEGGKIVHETWFNMPYPGMVHDFAVTDTHVIVPFFPLITDMTVLKQGGPFYQWHPDQRSHFAILPRWGTAREVRWFQGPAVSAGHMMNAFNEESLLHLDLCLYNGNCFDFFPSYDGSPFRGSPPQLTRLTFDLAGKHDGYEAKLLARTPTEMPKCDDRFMGKPYRYGFGICRSPTARAGEMGMGAIARFDHQTGTMATWVPGENCGVHEPNFVVKPGAPEGEGYLLVIVNRLAENHSDLAILNASDIAAGPIALLTLPIRVRSTFHGMWVSERALTTGRYVA
jgi:carotenoid cleavage dioxygenase